MDGLTLMMIWLVAGLLILICWIMLQRAMERLDALDDLQKKEMLEQQESIEGEL